MQIPNLCETFSSSKLTQKNQIVYLYVNISRHHPKKAFFLKTKSSFLSNAFSIHAPPLPIRKFFNIDSLYQDHVLRLKSVFVNKFSRLEYGLKILYDWGCFWPLVLGKSPKVLSLWPQRPKWKWPRLSRWQGEENYDRARCFSAKM